MTKTDVNAIRKQLHHPDSDVRWDAVLRLEEMEGEEATGLAIEALNDRDFEGIRWLAAVTLGKRGDPAATYALIETLQDRNYHIRKAAIEALGIIGNPAATEALIAMLKDPYPSVRIKSVRALIRIGDPAIEPLKHALVNADDRLGSAIRDALDELEETRR